MGKCILLLVVTLLFICSEGRNYDSLLEGIRSRNNKLQSGYLEENPQTQAMLNDLLHGHEWFQDTDEDYESVPNEIPDSDWSRLLHEISRMKNINEMPVANKVKRQFNDEEDENDYEQPKRLEELFQNHLNEEHRIMGGSSEVGTWLDYALQGARAQDDDETQLTNHRPISDVKVDKLPAYCDPPNPCPIGYDPRSMPAPCDDNILDTKEFNKDWIYHKMMAGECSCDAEHMKNCPRDSLANKEKTDSPDSPFITGEKRQHLVAKKTGHLINKRSSPNIVKRGNPYFGGQVLHRVTKKNGLSVH